MGEVEDDKTSLRSTIEAQAQEIERLKAQRDTARSAVCELAAELEDWKRNGHIYLVRACDRKDAALRMLRDALKTRAAHYTKLLDEFSGSEDSPNRLTIQGHLLTLARLAEQAIEGKEGA